MIWIIIGIFLKLFGIGLAIPNAVKHYRTWKQKKVSMLYEQQHWFVKTGKRPSFRRWQIFVFKMTKMPMQHLWKPQ